MKRFKLLVLFFSFIIPLTALAQKKINPSLSKQIDSLKEEDQKPAKLPADQAAEAFKLAVAKNFPLVKKILDTYGFPGYDLVGKESSHHYWLLVQHSDLDISFQKKALALMKVQLDRSNASAQDYAYLIDRININEGKQQIYGTQVNMSSKGTSIKPCIDTPNLDKRRLEVGLTPIKDYLKQCDEAYAQLNPERETTPKDSTKKLIPKPITIAHE